MYDVLNKMEEFRWEGKLEEYLKEFNFFYVLIFYFGMMLVKIQSLIFDLFVGGIDFVSKNVF